MNAADATAAPSTVILSGKTYRIAPLNENAIGELERFIQDRIVDVAKRNLKGLSDAVATNLLTHAYDKAARFTMGSADMLTMMNSLEVLVRLVWLALRIHQPEITENEVFKLMSDPSNLAVASNKINDLSGKGKRASKDRMTPAKRRK